MNFQKDTTGPCNTCVVPRFLTRPSAFNSSGNASGRVHQAWADVELSEDTQRRLLLSQNSVTALFEAQKLWDQGFAGAKVKMGVFDTGIRADHPHVKNIRLAGLSGIDTLIWLLQCPNEDRNSSGNAC